LTKTVNTGFIAFVERRFGGDLIGLVQSLHISPASDDSELDLKITGRTVEGFVTERILLGAVGLVLPVFFAGVMAAFAVHLPTGIVAALSLALAAGGFVLPASLLRTQAQERRRSFRYSLSAFLDLTAISLAAGGLVQGAMEDAVSVGTGWAFDEFRPPLDKSRQTGKPPWDELGRLGGELGVPELSELTNSLALAGTEGAQVRRSLMAKAESLRSSRLAEAEAEAAETSEKLALPLALLGLGFLLFIGFPAVSRVLAGAS